MATSEMLTAKIAHGFRLLDTDDDGRLDEQDHVLMGQRAAAALGLAPGSDEEARIIDGYVRIWRELHLPHLPEGATSISAEEFVASTASLAGDPDTARATVGAIAETFLDVADSDRDGQVNLAEYRIFLHGHFPGLPDEEIAEAFGHLDTDGSGYLSGAEFVDAVIDYWSSEDPDAPGNWWIGRPIYQR